MHKNNQTNPESSQQPTVRSFSHSGRPNTSLATIKKNLWAAFFLTSGVASSLLLLYFAFFSSVPAVVSFGQLQEVKTSEFRVRIPAGLTRIDEEQTKDMWTYANGVTPEESSLVITVRPFSLRDSMAKSGAQAAYLVMLETEVESWFGTSMDGQGVDTISSETDVLDHEHFTYSYRYASDGVYEDGLPVSTRHFILMDEYAEGYQLLIQTTHTVEELEDEQINAIARSFEVRS